MSTQDFVVKEAIHDVLEGEKPNRIRIPRLVSLVVDALDKRGHRIEHGRDVVRRAIMQGVNDDKWLHYDSYRGILRMCDHHSHIKAQPSDVVSSPVDDDKKEMRFFSAVAPGNCACNCLKSKCPTHWDL